MQVQDLSNIVLILERQGARVSIEDLRPELLGLDGYVGTTVHFPRVDRIERIWIKAVALTQYARAPDRAAVAEWLTLTLAEAGRMVPVKALIAEFLKHDLARGWPAILRGSMLSHTATKMGFVGDPLAKGLWLPHDHPLAEKKLVLPAGVQLSS